MSTVNQQMNAFLRTRRLTPRGVQFRERLRQQFDPEEVLDYLAVESAADPDILQKLDPATRRRLTDYLVSGEALGRELAARRERLQQAATAEQTS